MYLKRELPLKPDAQGNVETEKFVYLFILAGEKKCRETDRELGPRTDAHVCVYDLLYHDLLCFRVRCCCESLATA